MRNTIGLEDSAVTNGFSVGPVDDFEYFKNDLIQEGSRMPE